jgi:predicted nuclease with TOPRIM domain
MSTVTENDLQRLEGLINSKFEKVFEELTTIKIDIATLKESQNSLNTRIDETNKRLDSIDTRLNTVTLGVFGIIGVLVTGLLTFLGKIVFFPNI